MDKTELEIALDQMDVLIEKEKDYINHRMRLVPQLRDYIAGEPLSDPVAVDLCKQMLALLGERV